MDRWTGYLQAALQKGTTKTIVRDSYFQGALKITRPVYLDHTGQASLYIMNPGGGYLEGDRYYLDFKLEQGAEALITTQSSTKIYKCQERPAVQKTVITLQADSVLEYLPDPVIAYEHARFTQETTIRMERGAVFIGSEIFTPGWSADGRLFRYHQIRSRTEIEYDGELVLWDQLRLMPDDNVQGIGSFDGMTHVGSLLVIGVHERSGVVEELHEYIAAHLPACKLGVTKSAAPGFVLRVLANRTQEIEMIWGYCLTLIRKQWFQKEETPFLRKY